MQVWNGLEVGAEVPAAPGMAEAEVLGPALLIEMDALEANLSAMQGFADAAGLRLRPHAKTHRCAALGRLQMAAGAVGLCCQTLAEAEALAAEGLPDLLVTTQVRGPVRAARLARLAGRARTGVLVDDAANVAELSEAAAAAGVEIGVLVEVDVGMGRCGVRPEDAAALARAVDAAPGLRLDGIQAYQGAAQHAYGAEDRRALVAAAADGARTAMAALAAAGLPCPVVGGAGTGTFAIDAAEGPWTELQCGSYALMDADYARVRDRQGDAGPSMFRHALFLLAEVVSTAVPGRAVVTAGLKAHSVDSGPPALADAPPGVAFLGAADEHGVLADPGGRLRVGDRLRLIPGHVDPTVNLHDWLVCVRGGVVEDLWRVTARGRGL